MDLLVHRLLDSGRPKLLRRHRLVRGVVDIHTLTQKKRGDVIPEARGYVLERLVEVDVNRQAPARDKNTPCWFGSTGLSAIVQDCLVRELGLDGGEKICVAQMVALKGSR